MRLHDFNINGLFEYADRRYEHLTFAFGTFDLDKTVHEQREKWYDLREWCNENCLGEHVIFDTSATYIAMGIMDVTVIAFKEESDAMAFKLMWI